jgi:hypothetical protein
MARYEYQLQTVTISGTTAARDQQLLDAFNTFGRDGWRVVRVAFEPLLGVLESKARIFLEREVDPTEHRPYTGETTRL